MCSAQRSDSAAAYTCDSLIRALAADSPRRLSVLVIASVYTPLATLSLGGLDDSSLGLIYVTGREGWDGEGTGTASIVDDDGRWEEGAGRGRKGTTSAPRSAPPCSCRSTHPAGSPDLRRAPFPSRAPRGRAARSSSALASFFFFAVPGAFLGHYTRSKIPRRVKLLLENALRRPSNSGPTKPRIQWQPASKTKPATQKKLREAKP